MEKENKKSRDKKKKEFTELVRVRPKTGQNQQKKEKMTENRQRRERQRRERDRVERERTERQRREREHLGKIEKSVPFLFFSYCVHS